MSGLAEKIKKNQKLYHSLVSVARVYEHFKNHTLAKVVWAVCSKLPIQDNKVYLTNFNGRGFADNQKYIALELMRRQKDYKLIWLLQNPREQKLPKGIQGVKTGSFAEIYHMATAKYWINNVRFHQYFKKRKGQYYIQTWHAGLGFKRIEKDVEDTLSPEYIRMAKIDSAAIDLIVSNGKFMTNHFKRIFWYEGEFLEKGHPRNDIFYTAGEGEKQEIYQRLGIDEDKKTVLYAPTFRADYGLSAYDMDYQRVLSVLKEKFGGDWVLLVRLHPNLFDKFDELHLQGENIINASAYSDMQELLFAADVMITDFTSAMFEFAIMDKPCFLYASDLEKYMKERGLITLEEVPFPKTDSNDGLEQMILAYDRESYLAKVHEFMADKCCDRGIGAKSVADWMEEH
ncbi:MAG: CDP-glycerol glycerophosphotransferase family protein [Lachnospiraceae bacterium]|nr:CDP-glycerol glycerophosphotransferase family protein [Lachnospiraceae bacterium]